jgi:hypothetical protein
MVTDAMHDYYTTPPRNTYRRAVYALYWAAHTATLVRNLLIGS